MADQNTNNSSLPTQGTDSDLSTLLSQTTLSTDYLNVGTYNTNFQKGFEDASIQVLHRIGFERPQQRLDIPQGVMTTKDAYKQGFNLALMLYITAMNDVYSDGLMWSWFLWVMQRNDGDL